MKVVAGVTWVLTLSAGIGSASARAGARASGSSSNSILRDGAAFSSKRNEKLSTPHADSTAAKLNSVQEDSKESEIVTSVSGGQEVQTRRTSIGVLGVLGGALCHLCLGSTYCWGNFVPYVPARLKCFGDTPGCSDASYVLPVTFVAQTLSMPFSSYFQNKIGCQATTALGCAIMALGVFLSSFAPNLITFMLTYAVMFGTGVGLAYTAPMVNGWKWFPNKKGLVSGAVVAGFGSGGFVFNQIGTRIINPNGLNAMSGVYPDEVYANFPVMLRKLALIYLIVSAIGALAIKAPPKTITKPGMEGDVVPVTGYTVGEALKHKNFWLMWIMALLIGTGGINVANCYKQYGSTVSVLQSDSYQSMVGSVAALCNGAGRLFWGNMLDAFGFKKMFPALALVQTTATAFYTIMAQSKSGYLVGTGTLLFCLGGTFAMFPALTTKVFGSPNGPKIYGVVFSAFAVASISGTFLTKTLMSTLGWDWENVFKLMAFLSLCSIAALPTFEVPP